MKTFYDGKLILLMNPVPRYINQTKPLKVQDVLDVRLIQEFGVIDLYGDYYIPELKINHQSKNSSIVKIRKPIGFYKVQAFFFTEENQNLNNFLDWNVDLTSYISNDPYSTLYYVQTYPNQTERKNLINSYLLYNKHIIPTIEEKKNILIQKIKSLKK